MRKKKVFLRLIALISDMCYSIDDVREPVPSLHEINDHEAANTPAGRISILCHRTESFAMPVGENCCMCNKSSVEQQSTIVSGVLKSTILQPIFFMQLKRRM